MPAFIRLLCDRVALLVALSIPYVAAGFVFSALFVWLRSHVNPDPWVLPAMQFATALWTFVNLVLLVLLAIAYWRALFLGEVPRSWGLRVLPKVFLAVSWRALLIYMIATFLAQWVYYLSFQVVAQMPQIISSRAQHLIYYSCANLVICSIGLYLLSRLGLGLVSRSTGRGKLSVSAAWRCTSFFQREVLILSIQFGALVSALDAAVHILQMILSTKTHGHVPVLVVNLVSSLLAMLVILAVVWCLISAMAVVYSRAVGVPVQRNENVSASVG